jgi:AcrR family transcriptional regulator
MKARADRQRETRERIVAATEALHREVGPARTTIADIARRAGVERLTVYNHFPDLSQLLGACQANFLANHPPPAIAPGHVRRAEAPTRLEWVLIDLYAWFRANETMERNIHRDRRLVPELDELMRRNADPTVDAAAAAWAALLTRSVRKEVEIRLLTRLAFEFDTWRLVSGVLKDAQAAALMARAITSL